MAYTLAFSSIAGIAPAAIVGRALGWSNGAQVLLAIGLTVLVVALYFLVCTGGRYCRGSVALRITGVLPLIALVLVHFAGIGSCLLINAWL